MRRDIIEDVREGPFPTLIHSHPASGTQWLCFQLKAACEGPVAHETLHGKPIRHYKAVVSFRHWETTYPKYARIVACTRDPLRVFRSCYALYKRAPHIRGTVLMYLFGDGLPHGPVWSAVQAQDAHKTVLSSMDAWYNRAEEQGSKIDHWYRIEDAKQIIESRSNTKIHRMSPAELKKATVTWDDLLNMDYQVGMRMAARAARMGYEVPDSILEAIG